MAIDFSFSPADSLSGIESTPHANARKAESSTQVTTLAGRQNRLLQPQSQLDRGQLPHTPRPALETMSDALATSLRTDLRRLQEEVHATNAIASNDIFRTATLLSHVQDRLHRLESAFVTLTQTLQTITPQTAPPQSQQA
jgi:hypothetical protein